MSNIEMDKTDGEWLTGEELARGFEKLEVSSREGLFADMVDIDGGGY